MPRIIVDGREIIARVGSTVLEALLEAGIQAPHACHDPRLKPVGACRQCLVHPKGATRPTSSCTLPATDGLEVAFDTPHLRDLRATVISQVARHLTLGKNEPGMPYEFLQSLDAAQIRPAEPALSCPDVSHPYIQVDMSRCIDCYRCVRICEELQGQDVWKVKFRGDRIRVVPDSDGTFGDSTCVSCGACVDTCPTGALEDKSVITLGAPTSWTKTTCPYCGVGCELHVGVRDGRIVTVRPVEESPVSKGHLCVKGRYAHSFVYAGDRVTSPMIRRNGEWERVSWEDATAHIASEWTRLLDAYGPSAVGVLGSARATNEENYIAQKFARVVLGTNNVDCCARVCHAPSAAALKKMLGTGAATSCFDDIELASTIMVTGANPTECHPIVGARIRQAARRGAKLIIIDPRVIELCKEAVIHLQLRPGTNIAMLNGLAREIIRQGWADTEYIRSRTLEYEEFAKFVEPWTLEETSRITGVEAGLIADAAKLYATGKPSISFHGLGVTEHFQGTEGVMGLVNLALLTGNMGKPGTGANPLRGQNNVQGSAHMGCEPNSLTGMVDLASNREAFEQVWGGPIPTERGLNLLEMIDQAAIGKFRGMWVVGYDVFLTNANMHQTAKGFENMELVIVQDLFLNETARRFGTVFLPCSSSFEKDGTFMNSERRVQRVRRAIDPLGDSKSDWEIMCAVAGHMGLEKYFSFGNACEIWEEIRRVWKPGGGISYSRMEDHGVQWPCPTEDHPGTSRLHATSFPIGERAKFERLDFLPTSERVSEEFPVLLVTGRSLYQFNAGTMTMRTENRRIRPTDELECSQSDAKTFGLVAGGTARIKSRFGEAMLPVRVTDGVRPGEAFATFHDPEQRVNEVTGEVRDRIVGAPEYKVTAVRLEPAETLS